MVWRRLVLLDTASLCEQRANMVLCQKIVSLFHTFLDAMPQKIGLTAPKYFVNIMIEVAF
jgi:hypothetical protein